MFSLDIGCGLNASGEVNCDITHQKASNFILCDGEHLPFQNEIFSVVYANHVIEHVRNPYRFLSEALRVSDRRVLIRTPYRFSIGAKKSNHLHYFNKKWFYQQLKDYSKRIVIDYHFPQLLEINVDVMKG